MPVLALTLLVTSPFLYCFSRLAILEPLLTALTLGALNLAVRLPRMKKPVGAAAVIGLLFTLMLLTKTTAVFLLPARVDTKWFHDLVLPHAREIRFIRGRLKFVGAEHPAPFPSMIVVFRRDGL